MEDPAGYDPVAAGLKDQSLSIRVYARGPKTPFAIAAHRKCPVLLERWDAHEENLASILVHQSGIEPASIGYQPIALPLSYRCG